MASLPVAEPGLSSARAEGDTRRPARSLTEPEAANLRVVQSPHRWGLSVTGDGVGSPPFHKHLPSTYRPGIRGLTACGRRPLGAGPTLLGREAGPPFGWPVVLGLFRFRVSLPCNVGAYARGIGRVSTTFFDGLPSANLVNDCMMVSRNGSRRNAASIDQSCSRRPAGPSGREPPTRHHTSPTA